MESIPESMSDEENSSPDSKPRRYSRSPQSPARMSGTPTIRMRTPSGSIIYNPFHRDVMRKLGGFTCSPGAFSTPPPRHNDGTQPFAWSPNIKGDLFPDDIDENPTHQFQLQEHIDSQYDEEAQSFIGSFFNSQLVVPSPVGSTSSRITNLRKHVLTANNSMDSPLPRTSTAKPGFTPTGRKLSRSIAVMEVDVGVQTELSFSPSMDLFALLPNGCGAYRGDTVTREEPMESRLTLCGCHDARDGFRRSLFSPLNEDGDNAAFDIMHDFNACSPETCGSSGPRFNSSFDGHQLASPDLSPICSPNRTLNNADETLRMDTGNYQ